MRLVLGVLVLLGTVQTWACTELVGQWSCVNMYGEQKTITINYSVQDGVKLINFGAMDLIADREDHQSGKVTYAISCYPGTLEVDTDDANSEIKEKYTAITDSSMGYTLQTGKERVFSICRK